MKITDILVEDVIILDVESDTKSGVLEEMAAALAASVPGLETDRLLKGAIAHVLAMWPVGH